MSDVDRRKEISHKRILEMQEDQNQETARKVGLSIFVLSSCCGFLNFNIIEMCFKISKLNDIEKEIAAKLAKAEEFGNQGEVDESIKEMEEVEKLRQKKADYELYVS